jgi:hypothetical protein
MNFVVGEMRWVLETRVWMVDLCVFYRARFGDIPWRHKWEWKVGLQS